MQLHMRPYLRRKSAKKLIALAWRVHTGLWVSLLSWLSQVIASGVTARHVTPEAMTYEKSMTCEKQRRPEREVDP